MRKSEEIRNILKIERRKRNMNYKEFGALLDAADKAFKNLGITVTIGKKR